MVQFVITHETARQLEQRKEQIEKEMARLREEHALVTRKLEAIPLFLADANGHAPTSIPAAEERAETQASDRVSVPMAVKMALQEHGPLSAVGLRQPIMKAGVRREQLGATFSYLYTVLGRLESRREIQKVRGKYQLPPGVTHQYRPTEDDMKP